jgi:hypothetical protein
LKAVRYDFQLGKDATQGTGRLGADPSAVVPAH